jgi:predicted Na+-dependent transporter
VTGFIDAVQQGFEAPWALTLVLFGTVVVTAPLAALSAVIHSTQPTRVTGYVCAAWVAAGAASVAIATEAFALEVDDATD